MPHGLKTQDCLPLEQLEARLVVCGAAELEVTVVGPSSFADFVDTSAAAGKTPLILDHTADSVVATMLSHRSVITVNAKALVARSRHTPLVDLREELRQKVSEPRAHIHIPQSWMWHSCYCDIRFM